MLLLTPEDWTRLVAGRTFMKAGKVRQVTTVFGAYVYWKRPGSRHERPTVKRQFRYWLKGATEVQADGPDRGLHEDSADRAG